MTKNYVTVFYPRWLSYEQAQIANDNALFGPSTMTPVYHAVVAPNVDTIYVSTFMNIAAQPMILTVPTSTLTYSLLTTDTFGDIFPNSVDISGPAGVYGLTGPGFNGTLPPGVTQIEVPYNYSQWIFRVDRYAPDGTDQTTAAQAFAATLLAAPLSVYLTDPTAGAAQIVSVDEFAVPFKTAADQLIATDPITYLKQLQTAVEESSTPPLNSYEQQVANTFNKRFGVQGANVTPSNQGAFIMGTQTAHSNILNHYLTNTGSTNWITFTNIGNWGNDYLDRSGIAEFIQWGNNAAEARYYDAFVDSTGTALTASSSYVLTFPADNIPTAKRFWSVTAYTPDSITLIDNSANVYAVASYTPGLVTNSDGSISIYMAPTLPAGAPAANWLPTPTSGLFNVLLRVYGPEGSVADNTYVPPAIQNVSPQ